MSAVGVNVQTSSAPTQHPTVAVFGDEDGHVTGARADMVVNGDVAVQTSSGTVGAFLTSRPDGSVECKVYDDNVEVASLVYPTP